MVENMTNIVSAFEDMKHKSSIVWMLQGTLLLHCNISVFPTS